MRVFCIYGYGWRARLGVGVGHGSSDDVGVGKEGHNQRNFDRNFEKQASKNNPAGLRIMA